MQFLQRSALFFFDFRLYYLDNSEQMAFWLAGRYPGATTNTMNKYKLRSKLEFAISVAREAGDITRKYYQTDNLSVEVKSDDSPVSIADKKSEEHLRARIKEVFKDDGILGEEYREEMGTSGGRWILDPIDGTESFIRGVPLYSTLMGYEYEGEAVVGVAYYPALNEMVYAAKGMGAWWIIGQPGDREPVQAKVSSVEHLKNAMFVYTSHQMFHGSKYEPAFLELINKSKKSRGWSDSYAHILIATGRADALFDDTYKIWDCCALKPIIEEAGGFFGNAFGKPSHTDAAIIATNGKLTKEVVETVQRR